MILFNTDVGRAQIERFREIEDFVLIFLQAAGGEVFYRRAVQHLNRMQAQAAGFV